jgi:hypothetical protein
MSLSARLTALGYTLEHTQTKDDITDATWRRLVRTETRETMALVPVVVGGETLFRREKTSIDIPVTRSLYVVESKDGIEIYNGGVRYTLEEIEAEELAEGRGAPLPPKLQIEVRGG